MFKESEIEKIINAERQELRSKKKSYNYLTATPNDYMLLSSEEAKSI